MLAGRQFRVTTTALNLRSGPGRDTAIAALLRRGSVVTALETMPAHAGWLKVSADGRRGYVSRQFIEPVGRSPLSPSAPLVDVTRRNTDPACLHPIVRAAVAKLTDLLARESIPLRMFEGYRLPERQSHLYMQGRDGNPGRVVTYARAWESYHQYGLAADFVAYEDGQWSWDTSGERATWWKRLHELAREEDMEPLKFELPHVQLAGLTVGALRAGRFPAGADDSWLENLESAIVRSAGDPNTPPRISVRPPLVA